VTTVEDDERGPGLDLVVLFCFSFYVAVIHEGLPLFIYLFMFIL